MEVSLNGDVPQMDGLWGKIYENPIKTDDLGVPPF